jgi:hypothetical protein
MAKYAALGKITEELYGPSTSVKGLSSRCRGVAAAGRRSIILNASIVASKGLS